MALGSLSWRLWSGSRRRAWQRLRLAAEIGGLGSRGGRGVGAWRLGLGMPQSQTKMIHRDSSSTCPRCEHIARELLKSGLRMTASHQSVLTCPFGKMATDCDGPILHPASRRLDQRLPALSSFLWEEHVHPIEESTFEARSHMQPLYFTGFTYILGTVLSS